MDDPDTRARPAPDADLTVTAETDIDVGEMQATVGVEYRPETAVLQEGELYDMANNVAGVHNTPEDTLVALYELLVDALFPGYADRDAPWDYVPMVVDLSYYDGRAGMSMGNFR